MCFCTTKTTPIDRGKLAFVPGGCKGLSGFPGDFGAMGQDSIVGQSYILLILKSPYFKPGKADVFGLDVSLGSGWICAACIRHVNDPKGFGGFGR